MIKKTAPIFEKHIPIRDKAAYLFINFVIWHMLERVQQSTAQKDQHLQFWGKASKMPY